MRRFVFQFEAMLMLRRHNRDAKQRDLAAARQSSEELEARRRQVIGDRTRQLEEMRRLGGLGGMDVDAAARRRYFASQLMVDIAQLDWQRQAAEHKVRLCEAALIQADQSVRMLERLAENQRSEFLAGEEARAQRELEDTWQGAQAAIHKPR